MARVYEGLAARALGTTGGLLMFGTSGGMYVFTGATASNVPLSGRLKAAVHGTVPTGGSDPYQPPPEPQALSRHRRPLAVSKTGSPQSQSPARVPSGTANPVSQSG